MRVSWNVIKNFIESKKVSLQYIETDDSYELFACDGLFELESSIRKRSPATTDQDDFETNYKNDSNTNRPTVQQVALTLADDKFSLVADAFTFTAMANTMTTNTFKFTEAYFIRGLSFQSPNASIGDYIKIELIDIDNVLGFGANTVLKTPIKKGYVCSTTNIGPILVEDISASELPIANLYLKIYYTNTSLLNNVNVYINMILYKRD